jgi:hypothetical protein
MEAREPLKRIRTQSALLCAVATIALLAAAAAGRAAGPNPLSEIPPRSYVVATFNGSLLRLYLNGAIVAQALVTGRVQPTKAPLEIGSYVGRAIWSGKIDEVAVYDRALAPKRIAARYRLGINVNPPGVNAYRNDVLATKGLVSYWRLDDPGMVADDSHGHNNGAFTPAVARGASGLISGEIDKAAVFNGSVGSVKIPPSQSLDVRRAFTLEAWVTTVSVANRHIVSRDRSWFLKTNAYGQWSAGVYVKGGAVVSASSRIVAHGPKVPPRTSARTNQTQQGERSSFNPLWILILAVIAAAVAAWRRLARLRRG